MFSPQKQEATFYTHTKETFSCHPADTRWHPASVSSQASLNWLLFKPFDGIYAYEGRRFTIGSVCVMLYDM
jgi:hypothetical protein